MDYPLHWEAFNDLGTERNNGMGIGPIPFSKIKEYAADLGLTEREKEAFVWIIRKLDIHYLNKQAQEAAERNKS